MNKFLRKYGIVLIVLGITYAMWIIIKLTLVPDFSFQNSPQYVAQLLGLTVIILMSFNFILSARLYFFEKFFGGLDKMYKVHRMLGEWAFFLLIFHPVFSMIQNVAYLGWEVITTYLIPGAAWDYNWGILGFYVLTTIVIITLWVKLPYHIWKFIHRLMIVALVFAIIHVLMIYSDVTISPLLKIWVLAWGFTGVAAWIYVELFYQRIGPVHYYKVKSINLLGSITEIYLEPENKPMLYKAGQFTFISILNNPEVSSEVHPFSISSSPNEYYIRISAKNLGEYTATLTKLKQGDKVRLIGPYGFFSSENFKEEKNQVWVAGGIGITPFLSMIAKESTQSSGNQIIFFYSAKNREEGVYRTEIEKNTANNPNIKVIYNYDNENGFLNFERIKADAPDILASKILLCGPPGMMFALQKQFIAGGIKEENVIFEDFTFK